MGILIFMLTQLFIYTEFNSLNINEIKEKKLTTQTKPVISSDIAKISIYKTEEIFVFEEQAKKECNERLDLFKNYGISVIGCNTIEYNGDYTFVIEYISELKQPQSINSVIIADYISSKSYWNERLAKNELENSFSRFKNSPLKPIDKEVIEKDGEYYFKIKYITNNILRKSQNYVNFEKTVIGRYTFQSEAEKNINSIINLVKLSGVSVVRGRVIENDGNYSIEIEYANKRDNLSNIYKNPEYSIDRYTSDELFPFENIALKEGIKRNDAFSKLSIPIVLNYSVQKENDWSFGIDYIVKNIYRNGFFVSKEYKIIRYNSNQIYDFENEAKKELNERLKNLNSIGFVPISYKVFELGGGYSFFIDYIEKVN